MSSLSTLEPNSLTVTDLATDLGITPYLIKRWADLPASADNNFPLGKQAENQIRQIFRYSSTIGYVLQQHSDLSITQIKSILNLPPDTAFDFRLTSAEVRFLNQLESPPIRQTMI